LALAAISPTICGCPYAGLPEALTPYDLRNDPDGDGSLETARPVVWNGETARVAGGISVDPGNLLAIQSYLGAEIIGNNMPPPSEVDVFSLGLLDRGDQIFVSVLSLIQQIVNLTPLAESEMVRNTADQAVFLVDSASEIVGYPAAAPVAVDAAGEYFLVVQSFVPGDYVFTIERRVGLPAPAPRSGVLLLEFGGSDSQQAFVDRGGRLVQISELPPFDLEQARPDFVGQSERFQETLRQFVEFVYAEYDVLVTLDRTEAHAAGNYDTMVFTTPSPGDLGFTESRGQTLGIEPTIDVENSGPQVGVVFIQAFEESRFLDFNSYAALWASVAAHEYGHAVGLWHVRQESGCLMTPSLGGAGEGRVIRLLGTAEKQESQVPPIIRLLQNPDRYLSRILGRRPPDLAQAARQRTNALLQESAQP